jgi:hypothetical protein
MGVLLLRQEWVVPFLERQDPIRLQLQPQQPVSACRCTQLYFMAVSTPLSAELSFDSTRLCLQLCQCTEVSLNASAEFIERLVHLRYYNS